MSDKRTEELLTRWMDGVLTDAEQGELEPLLAADPGLAAEREDFLRMRDEIRRALPASEEPPYPEFFNTHLERLILVQRRAAAEPASGGGVWRMVRWWLAPAAAAAVVVAFLAGMQLGTIRDGGAPVVAAATPAVYSPIASVRVEAVRDESLGGTVIVLEGLEDIPSSVDLFQTAERADASGIHMISTGGQTF